jgi:hypothetical protein
MFIGSSIEEVGTTPMGTATMGGGTGGTGGTGAKLCGANIRGNDNVRSLRMQIGALGIGSAPLLELF